MSFQNSRLKYDRNSIENGIQNIDNPDFCFEWHHNDMAQEVETGECRIFNQLGIIRTSISCKITLSVKRTYHFHWPNKFQSAEPFAFPHNAFRKVHFESDLATFIY